MSTRRKRQGHVLALVLAVLGALVIGATVIMGRVANESHSHPADDARLQALWLARSAWQTGASGRSVPTPYGEALVQRSADTVTVTLGGAQAVVGGRPYAERYQPAP